MYRQWKQLWDIFFVFFKIGPTTFGGGFAMIPIIEKEIVEKRKWLSKEEITDMFALSQSIPGAIGVNVATFIGQRVNGLKGALAAMIGISFPTFFIVLLLGLAYFSMADNQLLEAAFISIRATIVALIAYAAINIVKTAAVDKMTVVLMLIGIPALFFLHPILVLLCGAIVGVYSTYVKRRRMLQSNKSNLPTSTDDKSIKRVKGL
ncbi:chromate transporter [Bacillus massiliigorillae]|uniref:chromate transporter n=1 Tax=Bacillus massiliigorillae TaxID=1243664 RepID=UPI00039AACB2|nr:chromate transporter [Bacillus massiliigorillae]